MTPASSAPAYRLHVCAVGPSERGSRANLYKVDSSSPNDVSIRARYPTCTLYAACSYSRSPLFSLLYGAATMPNQDGLLTSSPGGLGVGTTLTTLALRLAEDVHTAAPMYVNKSQIVAVSCPCGSLCLLSNIGRIL
jgi:hypothetical protein